MAVPGVKPQNFSTQTIFTATDRLAYVKDIGGGDFQDSYILLADFLASGGSLTVQGNWDATTNTPTLVSSTGKKGFFYRVSSAGTTLLDGQSVWAINDHLYFDGTVWRKLIPNPFIKAGVPGLTDDDTKGFLVGSILLDTVANFLYVCVDNTTGAALWEKVTGVAQKRPFSFNYAGGPQTFTLPSPPPDPSAVTAFRNGQESENGVNFTVTGTTLTWVTPALVAGVDRISGFYNDQALPAGVDSVFGRSGIVVQVVGDYAASQVTNDSSLSGTTVKDALDNLQTKEISVKGGPGGTPLGAYDTTDIGANGSGEFTFYIPIDFISLVSVVLVGIVSASAAGATKDIDLTSEYGAIGEASNFNTETNTTTLYDLTGTAGQLTNVLDLSIVLNNLSAGDKIGIAVDHNGLGGTINYIEINLVYLR